MKKALYSRVSTDTQAEKGHSIEAQLEKLRAYCVMNDLTDTEEYIDAGYSASTLDRPAIKQLIQDIKLGLVDTVVVYKLDRLSRKTRDTLYLVEDVFIKHNVKFVSLSESIDTSTSSGKFFLSILSSVAQLERENIKERSTMGRKKQARSGVKERTPKILIGYDYDDKTEHYIVNEYEAMQVRLVYQWYNEGISVSEILRKLQTGYTTKYGTWNELRSVQHILDNESYTGKFYFGGELHDAKNVPPIISQELFDKTKKIRDYKKRHYYRHHSGYLLTGLIYCAHCGARLRGFPHSRGDYAYYSCYSRSGSSSVKHMKKKDSCELPYIRTEKLDEAVENVLRSVFTSKKRFEAARTKSADYADADLAALEKESKSLAAKSSRIMDLLIDAEIDKDTFLSRLEEINAQREKVSRQIEKAKKAQIDKNNITYQQGGDLLKEYKNGDTSERRKILASLIGGITVFADGSISIKWRF